MIYYGIEQLLKESNTNYSDDIMESVFSDIDYTMLTEANLDNVMDSPANMAGWVFFPYISLARYLIRTSQKKKMIKAKLEEVEDPIERAKLKKELMSLTKEELKAKMKAEEDKADRLDKVHDKGQKLKLDDIADQKEKIANLNNKIDK